MNAERFFMIKAPGCFALLSSSDRASTLRTTTNHDRVGYAARKLLSGDHAHNSTIEAVTALSQPGANGAERQPPRWRRFDWRTFRKCPSTDDVHAISRIAVNYLNWPSCLVRY